MRLIDADAVIADVKKNNQTNFDKQDWTSRNVCTLLIGAPTIDAVPVVRCRECKHYREALSQTSDNAVVVWCAADKYPHNDVMPDDWYCAAGEREEEEQDNE